MIKQKIIFNKTFLMKQKKILDENLTFALDFSVLRRRIIIESYIPSNSSFSILHIVARK